MSYARTSRRNCRPHRMIWRPVIKGDKAIQVDGTVYRMDPKGWRRIGRVAPLKFGKVA